MSDNEGISINWWDAETGNEIEAWYFPTLDVRPFVGDHIHYWQDGDENGPGGAGKNRFDYVVEKVEHDLRFMPARGGRPKYVQSLNVYLKPQPL